MRFQHWRPRFQTGALACVLLCAAAACGGDETDTDTAADTVSDSAPDSAPDSASDTAPDSASDTAPDSASDTAPDSASDTDAGPPPVLAPVAGEPNFAVAQSGWYRGDLHYHTNYSEDAKKQGGDDLDVCLEIADAFRHPDYTSRHPELAGNGLDFIAITDHRTDAALSDPDFTHDHLIILPGEEYGGTGHAGIWGLDHHITQDPIAGETPAQRHLDAIAEAHAQGALFSPNHPTQDNSWVWDTPDIDAIEVWNGPWTGFYQSATVAQIEERIASTGAENPYIRAAVTGPADGANASAVRFWQAHLTAGVHVPIVGGSDRHMLLSAALPATYVQKPEAEAFAALDGPALGVEGILQGIREGSTFVSRSPVGPQMVLEAEDGDGKRYRMGAELPGPGSYRVHIRVSRAEGGRARLIAGPLRAAVDGRVTPEPAVVFDEPVTAPLVEGSFEWQVPAEGGWLHGVVLEQLAVGPLPPEGQAILEQFSQPAEGNPLVVMGGALLPLADSSLVLDPSACDPDEWTPWMLQCMTVDVTPLPTFYVPDGIERLLNIYFEDGAVTEYSMGAITSAFLARP
ncbi:MAG: CehA/McbA family metallohydrolase [Deltaproteobacteria bacterium]|nr:CehA/McbA family metallohydrolase [Deltaproteobacteria bacterium]